MACEGYEHGQRVVAIRRLEEFDVPRGTVGTITGIHRERHTIDVRFINFGVLKELDAHAFTPDAEDEPPPPATAAM